MKSINQVVQAGTLESSDIMITLSPANAGSGIEIELISPVLKQFGDEIKAVIRQTLLEWNIEDAKVHANDKGALDCTIEARMTTAIERAIR